MQAALCYASQLITAAASTAHHMYVGAAMPCAQHSLSMPTACSCSLRPCFADTVYLPALQEVSQDLHADPTLVAASVSVFMFAVGVGNLVW